MANVAALFLAIVRSCFKKYMYYENLWDLLFSFFCDAWKIFALFAELFNRGIFGIFDLNSSFSQNIEAQI